MRTLKLAVLSAILAIGLAACTATTSPSSVPAPAPTVESARPPPGVTPLPNPNAIFYQIPDEQVPYYATDTRFVVRGTVRAIERPSRVDENGQTRTWTRILVNAGGPGCYYSFSAPTGVGGELRRGMTVSVIFHPLSSGSFSPGRALEDGKTCGNAQPETTGYAVTLEIMN